MCPGSQNRNGQPGDSRPPVERLLYRPAEAAEALGVSRSKMYELMNRRDIPWVLVGRSRRVPVEALRQLIGTAGARDARLPR